MDVDGWVGESVAEKEAKMTDPAQVGGWMDGWMDGCDEVGGWMDGWMGGWVR